MVSNGVCAVVVTYNPQPRDLENLSKVRAQVQKLVVVDNGSPKEALEFLRKASGQIDFTLIENGKNLGLAAALNVGVERAKAEGYQWVHLFDQDSTVTDGFVTAMLMKYSSHPASESRPIGIMVPSYVDQNRNIDLPPLLDKNQELIAAMTSGSLIPMSVIAKHGKFNEDLFVDVVDVEYSLRLRRLGYLIVHCKDAVLMHSPGYPEARKLFGLFPTTASNYSAERRYLKSRNKIWLLRNYWRTDLYFCVSLCAGQVRDTVKMFFIERSKWKKLVYTFRGFLDGFLGKMQGHLRA